MIKTLACASALVAWLLAPFAMADNTTTDPDADSLVETVVTATRIPTPQAQVASSITVITAQDIAQQQLRTLPDVLKDVPGLNLVQTGGPGGQTSIFMRGTNSNHIKVLVDGVDVSDPSNPNASFDFGQFLTQDIQRVEILRGPQSGLYGSDAIGGVINIITNSGSGPAQFSGAIEGGSFETFNQWGSVSGSSDQFHYSANVEHLHSAATPVTPLDLLAPGESRIDDYYDNLTASTKLGFDVTSNFDLGLVARYTDTHRRFTGENETNFPLDFPDSTQSVSDTIGTYDRATAHLVSLDGAFEQTLGFAYTHNRSANFSPENPEALDTGERTKVDWQGILKFSRAQTLLLGAEHSRDEISEPISAGTTINSGYAELQSQINHRLFSALNVRYDDNDRFGSKVTYRVAPTYLIEETDTRLKASVGTGFKAPTLGELFQSFPPSFFANPNLKPESSVGYDAGVEQGVGDLVRVGITYFYNRIHDLIDTDVTGTTYANIGRATADGVESFLSYRPIKALMLRADYTYTEATDDVLHQELLRRPKNKGSVSATWQATAPFSLNATVLTVGSWIDDNRDFSIPRLRAPGYTVANLAGTYDLTNNLSVFGRIDNLLDRHYEIPVGFLQPRLGAFAGIKAKL
jgi:vitamin B12 transporter